MAPRKGNKGTPKPGGTGYPNGGMFGFTLSQQQASQRSLLAQAGLPTNLTSRAASRVATDQAYAINKFGTGLSGSVKKIFVGARATAQQQQVQKTAGLETVKVMGKTLTQVGTIFDKAHGVQSAAYASAMALQKAEQAAAQVGADNEFKQQVYMAELQHQWALQEARAAAKATQQAAGATGQDAMRHAQGIVNSTKQVQPVVSEVLNSAIESNPEGANTYTGLNVNAIAAQALTQLGYDETDPEAEYVQSIVRQAVTQKTSVGNAVVLAQDELFSALPGYEKWGDKAAFYSQAEIKAAETAAFSENVQTNPGYRTQSGSHVDYKDSPYRQFASVAEAKSQVATGEVFVAGDAVYMKNANGTVSKLQG